MWTIDWRKPWVAAGSPGRAATANRLQLPSALPWLSWATALAAAYGLKLAYSRAAAEDLSWILAPTARVVGWLRGEALTFQPGLGWASPDGSYFIAPACAGVNFLIVAFVVAVLGFSHRLGSRWERLAGWLAALAGAYLLTLAVNALRIVGAVELYRIEFPVAWLTPERVHRLWGIAVYLGALWGLWWGLDALTRPGKERPGDPAATGRNLGIGRLLLIPLVYLGMTVVTPLLTGSFRQGGAEYVEHAMMVSLATALVLSVLLFFGRRRGAR